MEKAKGLSHLGAWQDCIESVVAEDNRCVRVSVQSKKKKKTYKNESLRVGGCSINGVLHVICWFVYVYQCVFEHCLGGRICLRG